MSKSLKDIVATDRKMHTFRGLDIVHEVYDGNDAFYHRLTCLDFPPGEWVVFQWFATIEIDGRKFMACQDNWTPMFPSCFEVTLPSNGG